MRIKALEELAKREVGRRGSRLSFVTTGVGGDVRAVFVNDLKSAITYARSLAGNGTVVEDHTGVRWDSEYDT